MTIYRTRSVSVRAWRWLFNQTQEKAPAWVNDALWVWPRTGGLSFQPDHAEGARLVVGGLPVQVALPGDWLVVHPSSGYIEVWRDEKFTLWMEADPSSPV